MGWSARAKPSYSPMLPTTLIDGKLELMDWASRAPFHLARDKVLDKAQAVDADLYRGGLSLDGSGRVLSLLSGHGGSVVCMDVFNVSEVKDMYHGADMLDPNFVIPQLVTMGFDPHKDPLGAYYWSAVEFVRTCADLGLGIECDRH